MLVRSAVLSEPELQGATEEDARAAVAKDGPSVRLNMSNCAAQDVKRVVLYSRSRL